MRWQGMMVHVLRVMGTIIVLVLLLAVIVGAAQHLPAASEQGKAVLTSTESVRQVEDTVTVCGILIGGTALLAGLVWMERLR
jgi:hypothetical protein